MTLATGLGVTAMLSAFGGLVLLTLAQRMFPRANAASIFQEGEDATVFLFDEKDLLDASPSGLRLLQGSSFPDKPWQALMERLAGRFADLEERLADLAVTGYVVLSGASRAGVQPVSLRAELRGGVTRITLVHPGQEKTSYWGDVLTMHAVDGELAELRDATNGAHFPMWRMAANGAVTWANGAYMDLLFRTPGAGEIPDWRFRPLFDSARAKGDMKDKPLRRLGPDMASWFDITVKPVGDGVMCYALPADAAVAVEGTLQDFKRTLTNTFAELSTGLAVFDGQRRLQLFNPALSKLIDVPVDFLLKRPALFTLLDAMRDRNMLPEPKDYKSWRRQMVDLEAMSLRGEYQDIWHLPNGQAFRVVGRPYPNGAVALMVDDITDQVVRDRLARMELDSVLTMINKADEAIIAFSSLGRPVVANESYRQMWGHDPLAEGAAGNALDLLEQWRGRSTPSLLWSEVESVLSGVKAEIPMQVVQMLDGTAMSCRAMLLPDGGAGVFFRIVSADSLAIAEDDPPQRMAVSA